MRVLRALFVQLILADLPLSGCRILSPTGFFAQRPSISPGFVLCLSVNISRLIISQYFVYDDSTWSIKKAQKKGFNHTDSFPLNLFIVFDCGSLKHDQHAAENYRQASLQYFQFILLGLGSLPGLSEFDSELQNALHCWDEVGEHIREVCSEGTHPVIPEFKFNPGSPASSS